MNKDSCHAFDLYQENGERWGYFSGSFFRPKSGDGYIYYRHRVDCKHCPARRFMYMYKIADLKTVILPCLFCKTNIGFVYCPTNWYLDRNLFCSQKCQQYYEVIPVFS